MIIDIEDLKKQLNSHAPGEALAAEKEAVALAEQGNLEAAEMLVSTYADGRPAIRADRVKEFKYTKIAAELGSSFSRFWLAHLQRESKDFAGALENARLAHQMGESNAATLLARMMLAGEGQPAKPLDALQLLSESVEGGGNTDAAILLAEVYLGGKHIPQAPQNAYDVLEHQSTMFNIMRHVSPETYARWLYLKAEAIRLGAVPAEGESHAALIEKAADAGESNALALRRDLRSEAASRAQEAEWESICHFEAFRGKWQMFFKAATLLGCANKSHTSVSGFNGNISTSTAHWTVATFATESGARFEVSVPARSKLVQGREYAVLYIGPENEDRGTPTMIFDLSDGSVVKANGDFFQAYPKNASKLLAALGTLLMVVGILAAFSLFAEFHAGALVWVLGGMAGYKLRKSQLSGYHRAIADAGRFFGKHRQKK
jgi:hypothetical protein